MTILIAKRNILHWANDRMSHPVDLNDPWFGGKVIEPGTSFSEQSPQEIARLVTIGAARLQ